MSVASLSTEDRGRELIAMYWSCGAIASIAVALRCIARHLSRSFGWDDWAMLCTLAMYFGLAGFATAMASFGGCRHIAFIPPLELSNALRYNWAAQSFGIFGYATGKLSIALLILRIIGPTHVVRRYLLWGVTVLTIILSGLAVILTFAQCSPPRALWEPNLLATGQATCWDPQIQSRFGIFIGSWNVATDVFLAVLPMTIINALNISLVRKLPVMVLLSLGLLAAIFGALKTARLSSLTARSDLSWETFPLFAWSGAELFVLIVCGSIPPMRLLYDRVVNRGRFSRSGYTITQADMDSSKYDNASRQRGLLNTTNNSNTERNAHAEGLAQSHALNSFDPNRSAKVVLPGRILRTTEVEVTS